MDNPGNQALFFVSPPTLKTLASQELALDICRHVIRNEVTVDDPEYGFENLSKEYFLHDYGPWFEGVPKVLDEMIADCLYAPVVVSVQRWCTYHKEHVFYDSSNQYFHNAVLNCLDEFVLKPDGTINYLQTAKNILNDNKLNEADKYKFACTNCLVEYVGRFWPFVSDNSKRNLEKYPLMRYWTAVMKCELRQLFENNFNWSRDVMNILYKSEWTAIHYFYSFFSNSEQTTVLKMLLERREPDIFYHVFQRMNDEQLEIILRGMAVGDILFEGLIWRTAWTNWEYSKWILATWNRVKNFISTYQFTNVINAFLKPSFEEGCGPVVDPLLFQVWTSAPVHFKEYIQSDMQHIKKNFQALGSSVTVDLWRREPGADMKFFIDLLTNMSFQSRNALWHEFWSCIIIHANLKSLRIMMRLCLNNEDEIIQFKEGDMMKFENIKDFCCLLISCGHASKLSEYLNFCSSNGHLVANLKRQILQFEKIQCEFVDNNDGLSRKNLIDFDNFVASAFSNEDDIKKYQNQLLELKSTRESQPPDE